MVDACGYGNTHESSQAAVWTLGILSLSKPSRFGHLMSLRAPLAEMTTSASSRKLWPVARLLTLTCLRVTC